MAIVLWIGIIITAQAFQTTKKEHAPAVAIGLFPAIAAWGLLILGQTLGAAGIATKNLGLASEVLKNKSAFYFSGLHLEGLVAISQGFMITCMVWASISTYLIDKNFKRAAIWSLIGALFSFFGLIHAGEMTPAGGIYHIGIGTGLKWCIGYFLCFLYFIFMKYFTQNRPE